MTDKQINKVIAETCGCSGKWRFDRIKQMLLDEPPDYCNDLNAMHEAEKIVKKGFKCTYDEELNLISERDYCLVWETTARQRAEAFLKTLEKWEE
jgi:hypothetical protein